MPRNREVLLNGRLGRRPVAHCKAP
jgi:hypothetical protein